MRLHFLLNDREVNIHRDGAESALAYLREQTGLTGTKAGCLEGGCGACTVLLGKQEGQGEMRYRAVNSCLLPLGALAESHLVTIEGLGSNELTPVQRALVDEGAIQCGFCTPGLVMALSGYLLNGRFDDSGEALQAIDGNLCRCTGYGGVRRAARRIYVEFQDLPRDPAARRRTLIGRQVLPDWFDKVTERLEELPRSSLPPAGAAVVAGGTDLFSHGQPDLADNALWFLERRTGWSGVVLREGCCHIRAATTIEELLESDLLESHLPHVHRFLSHIGATPVRDRATVGGNLANASPIADLCICLLALDADVLLQGPVGERRLPLSELFSGYKTLAKADQELIAAVEFPLPSGEAMFNFEKVAHRAYLDIAAVNSAMSLYLDGDCIQRAVISAGGVGPIPRRLAETSDWLRGQRLDANTVGEVARAAMEEVSPIDDVHGSAAYKRLLLGQLVRAHFITLASHEVDIEPA